MQKWTFKQVAVLVSGCVAVMWLYAIYCHEFWGGLYDILKPLQH